MSVINEQNQHKTKQYVKRADFSFLVAVFTQNSKQQACIDVVQKRKFG